MQIKEAERTGELIHRLEDQGRRQTDDVRLPVDLCASLFQGSDSFRIAGIDAHVLKEAQRLALDLAQGILVQQRNRLVGHSARHPLRTVLAGNFEQIVPHRVGAVNRGDSRSRSRCY